MNNKMKTPREYVLRLGNNMETPRDYVERVSNEMEHRKGRLDEMLAKYESAMETPVGYAVPTSDPVYNSKESSPQLKEAMRTRKLNGMTQEDFENEYKRISHGIKSLETSVSDESEEPETAIVKADNSDIVPTSIDRMTAMEAGHTPSYLLKKCGEYQITRAQLADMIRMKARYHTVIPTILELIDKGYSIEEASELLETRELCEANENAPSLTKIMALQKRFNLPADSDILNPAIEMIREQIGTLRSGDEDYIDSAISKVLHMAKGMNTENLETVLDFMTNATSSVAQGSDDYSEVSKP